VPLYKVRVDMQGYLRSSSVRRLEVELEGLPSCRAQPPTKHHLLVLIIVREGRLLLVSAVSFDKLVSVSPPL
jgi:hypothetical protein